METGKLILEAINLLGLIKQPPPAAAAASTNASSPWIANVEEIELDDYTVNFEDKKPGKTAKLKLDQIALNLKGVDYEQPTETDLTW